MKNLSILATILSVVIPNSSERAEDTSEDAALNSDGSYTSIGRTASTNGDVTSNRGLEDVWLVKFKFGKHLSYN